ncbi:MAG: GNAT family N-acetyltransferase [Bacteroidales bacterium]|nr:GNAT family N-acetyltransferase [Bacteroidales bacterium]
MGKNQLTDTLLSQPQAAASSPSLGEQRVTLVAEEGASFFSGSLRLYALLSSGGVCGCLDLYAYDPLNRRCAVGIMVATEYRRQGYALAMLQALEAHFSPTLHTLYADIAATNAASLALFRKAGYTECGHFHDWLCVKDHFIDNIRMQKTLP